MAKLIIASSSQNSKIDDLYVGFYPTNQSISPFLIAYPVNSALEENFILS